MRIVLFIIILAFVLSIHYSKSQELPKEKKLQPVFLKVSGHFIQKLRELNSPPLLRKLRSLKHFNLLKKSLDEEELEKEKEFLVSKNDSMIIRIDSLEPIDSFHPLTIDDEIANMSRLISDITIHENGIEIVGLPETILGDRYIGLNPINISSKISVYEAEEKKKNQLLPSIKNSCSYQYVKQIDDQTTFETIEITFPSMEENPAEEADEEDTCGEECSNILEMDESNDPLVLVGKKNTAVTAFLPLETTSSKSSSSSQLSSKSPSSTTTLPKMFSECDDLIQSGTKAANISESLLENLSSSTSKVIENDSPFSKSMIEGFSQSTSKEVENALSTELSSGNLKVIKEELSTESKELLDETSKINSILDLLKKKNNNSSADSNDYFNHNYPIIPLIYTEVEKPKIKDKDEYSFKSMPNNDPVFQKLWGPYLSQLTDGKKREEEKSNATCKSNLLLDIDINDVNNTEVKHPMQSPSKIVMVSQDLADLTANKYCPVNGSNDLVSEFVNTNSSDADNPFIMKPEPKPKPCTKKPPFNLLIGAISNLTPAEPEPCPGAGFDCASKGYDTADSGNPGNQNGVPDAGNLEALKNLSNLYQLGIGSEKNLKTNGNQGENELGKHKSNQTHLQNVPNTNFFYSKDDDAIENSQNKFWMADPFAVNGANVNSDDQYQPNYNNAYDPYFRDYSLINPLSPNKDLTKEKMKRSLLNLIKEEVKNTSNENILSVANTSTNSNKSIETSTLKSLLMLKNEAGQLNHSTSLEVKIDSTNKAVTAAIRDNKSIALMKNEPTETSSSKHYNNIDDKTGSKINEKASTHLNLESTFHQPINFNNSTLRNTTAVIKSIKQLGLNDFKDNQSVLTTETPSVPLQDFGNGTYDDANKKVENFLKTIFPLNEIPSNTEKNNTGNQYYFQRTYYQLAGNKLQHANYNMSQLEDEMTPSKNNRSSGELVLHLLFSVLFFTLLGLMFVLPFIVCTMCMVVPLFSVAHIMENVKQI